jgi:hypothetical protein
MRVNDGTEEGKGPRDHADFLADFPDDSIGQRLIALDMSARGSSTGPDRYYGAGFVERAAPCYSL